MAQHNISGSKAEDMACEYLKVQGFKILQRNYKDRFCEIDIIASNKKTLSFVEVKYRRRSDFGGAVGAITADKFKRMQLSAEFWLSQNQEYATFQPRLDVIAITGDITHPHIDHLENVDF